MMIKQLQAAIEAILFASGEPISLDRIACSVQADKTTVRSLIELSIDKFESENSGIYIAKLDDKYQMCTKPQFGDYIRKAMDMRRNVPLSSKAMEVLAIIAYNQPVTKSFVEQVRGVDCSGIISSLSNKGLIEEKGRLELPGRPLLYGTSANFLRCFNISSIDELPPVIHEGDTSLNDKESKNDVV